MSVQDHSDELAKFVGEHFALVGSGEVRVEAVEEGKIRMSVDQRLVQTKPIEVRVLHDGDREAVCEMLGLPAEPGPVIREHYPIDPDVLTVGRRRKGSV